jgi:hypothetical protein
MINYIVGSAARHREIEHALQQIMWNLDGSNQWKKMAIMLRIINLFTLQNLWVSLFGKKRRRTELL